MADFIMKSAIIDNWRPLADALRTLSGDDMNLAMPNLSHSFKRQHSCTKS